jgi:hypothetical protein
MSWNSTVGCTKLSLVCKSGYAESEQGCNILKGLVTAAPREARAGGPNSLGMSGNGDKRHHGLPKQLIDD